MSLKVQDFTLNSRTVRVLMVQPNWAEPPKTLYRMESHFSESVTGRSHRRAHRYFPRLALRYKVFLTGDDAQLMRSTLGGLDSTLVGIPLWMDKLPSASWSSRIHRTQVNVGWDNGEAYDNLAVSTGGSTPAGDEKAPLLIGRLARPRFIGKRDDLLEFEISIEEEGLYAWRLTALAGSTPSVWDDDNWQPNWTDDPREQTRDFLLYETLGRGRLQQVQGTAGVRYSQSAGFTLEGDNLSGLLEFWRSTQGGVSTFDMPSFLQPGTGSANAPHEYGEFYNSGQMRFAGDIAVDWPHPRIGELTLDFEQVEDEDNLAATARSPHAFLYKITRGSLTYRLTDWESDVVVPSDGTYTAARIEHEDIRSSRDPSQDNARLRCSLDDCPLWLKLAQGEHEEPVNVSIFEVNLDDDPIAKKALFIGRLRRPEFSQYVMSTELTWLGSALAKQVPNMDMSVTCNHCFLSEGCSRRRPTDMTEAKWETTATLHPHATEPQKAILRSVSHPTSPSGVTITPDEDEYFIGGWFTTGSGIDAVSRYVKWSEWHGTDLVLTFARALIWGDITTGQACKVIPGCNGSLNHCREKFANEAGFGGFPQLPSFFYVQNAAQTGGGK